MSVRFVHTGDNKYAQYRCKTQSFSANPEDWYFEKDETLVENPEYIKAITDNAGHLMCWLRKKDGGVDWAVGVPKPVREYVNAKVAEIWQGNKGTEIDGLNKIIAFLDDFSTSDTLKELLDTKVDKEKGKSLIDEDFAEGISTIENPEYIKALADNDGKLLEAYKKSGKKEIETDVRVKGEATFDKGAKIEGDANVKGDFTVDGIAEFESVKIKGNELLEVTGISIEGEEHKLIEDPENRSELLLDSDGKIVRQRSKKGVLYENVGIETPDMKANKLTTNSLNLTRDALTEFEQVLKDDGYRPGGAGDFSDKTSMYIPEPRLAHLNIITDFDLTTLTKTSDVIVVVEFYDNAGNYFKKYAIVNGQGRSSLSFLKKGLGIDFFNEDPNNPDFDEDNVFKMKFGDWVYQDSFHVKSYYTDWPRCTTPVIYKLTNEVHLTRGLMADRPYKKYYVGEYSDSANANSESDLSHNMETGARCIPAGFPVIVYQNGEFWGVNSWQLKKHRDNYQLNNKKDTNVHLDGDMGTTHQSEITPPIPTPYVPFWLWDGTVDWTVYCSGRPGIETRNPKNLYCIDGVKYDVDTHDAEIIDTETAETWIAAGQIIPTGKTIDDKLAGYLRTTGKVRKHIEDLTTYIPTIRRMATMETSNGDIRIREYGGVYDAEKNFSKGVWVVSDGNSYMSIHTTNTGHPVSDTSYWFDITEVLADIKETIMEMFDIDSFIDYIVIGNVCGDGDAWDNNGQIVTWGKLEGSDILNWSVNTYDCDISFGCQWDGRYANAAFNSKLGINFPLYQIFWYYFYEEIKARYQELRRKGIIDADHIIQLFRDWMDRVGYENYKKEYEKWPESPCFRDGEQTYTHYPTTGGFYGSIYRIYLWVKKRIEYMDEPSFFDYNN